MKLLLDANISWRLTSVLSEHFGECVHVNKTELPKPAKDTEIWNYAAANNYTIITQDDIIGSVPYKRFFALDPYPANTCSSDIVSSGKIATGTVSALL